MILILFYSLNSVLTLVSWFLFNIDITNVELLLTLVSVTVSPPWRIFNISINGNSHNRPPYFKITNHNNRLIAWSIYRICKLVSIKPSAKILHYVIRYFTINATSRPMGHILDYFNFKHTLPLWVLWSLINAIKEILYSKNLQCI